MDLKKLLIPAGLISAYCLFKPSKAPSSYSVPSEISEMPLEAQEIYVYLVNKGVSKQGAKYVIAHAIAESGRRFKPPGAYNYWNFGKPAWWSSYDVFSLASTAYVKNDVGRVLVFPNLGFALDSFLELLRRGRENYYAQIFSVNPNVDLIHRSLCPTTHGFPSENDFASACKTKPYAEEITSIYRSL